MRCQARVEDMTETFPNTRIVYHTTKQCEEDASRKYSVDDGDSEMLLCGGCFRRCLSKKNKGSSWLGFFDCSYPPDAKVKGSRWYFWMLSNSPPSAKDEGTEELCDEMAKCSLSEAQADADADEADAEEADAEEADAEQADAEQAEEAEEADAEKEEAEEVEAEPQVEEAQAEPQVEEVEVQAQVEAQKEESAEKIKARIASLQAFVKASRGMPVKEQAKILKEIINLRTELKKNK